MAKKANLDWKDDMEKITTGILLIVITLAAIYKYITTNTVDQGIIYLCGLICTAFIARKGLSYWKPDQYYKNNNQITTQATIIPYSQVQTYGQLDNIATLAIPEKPAITESVTYEDESNGAI